MLHFSVDDVFLSLIEASQSDIELFQHPFFRYLLFLHEKYGLDIDLYLFYETEKKDGTKINLSEVDARFQSDFVQNPWLCLGPHALNYETAPFQQTDDEQKKTFELIYGEIERFAGIQNFVKKVRLHYFSESFHLHQYWKIKNVKALLLTDKPAISYHLEASQIKQLGSTGCSDYKGLQLFRSHVRLENYVMSQSDEEIHSIYQLLKNYYEQHSYLSIFTHEIDITEEKIFPVAEKIISYACQLMK